MRYELTDLRVFFSIANARSLTMGALDMHMTAPSASYRLKNLEESLGVPLFERTAKGMTLTAAGETVYRHAQTILGNIDQLHGDIARFTSGVIGQIRIFANSSTIMGLVTPLSRYLPDYPNINIDLEEHLSEDIVRAVKEGMADIGLIAGAIHIRDLESIAYDADELVLVVPPGHALAERERVAIHHALQYDMVSVGRNSSNFLFLQKIAQTMNHCFVKVRVHMPNFDAVIRCVQEGAGIALVPLSVASGPAAAGLLRIVRVDEHWAQRPQMIVARSLDALPDHAQALIQRIVQHAAAQHGTQG